MAANAATNTDTSPGVTVPITEIQKHSREQEIQSVQTQPQFYKLLKENADSEATAFLGAGAVLMTVTIVSTVAIMIQSEQWPVEARMILSWLLFSCSIMPLSLAYVESRRGKNAAYYFIMLDAKVGITNFPELENGNFSRKWALLWKRLFYLLLWFFIHFLALSWAIFALACTQGTNSAANWLVFALFCSSHTFWMIVLLYSGYAFQFGELATTIDEAKKNK